MLEFVHQKYDLVQKGEARCLQLGRCVGADFMQQSPPRKHRAEEVHPPDRARGVEREEAAHNVVRGRLWAAQDFSEEFQSYEHDRDVGSPP